MASKNKALIIADCHNFWPRSYGSPILPLWAKNVILFIAGLSFFIATSGQTINNEE
jgi:hypothetical protein